MMKTIVLVAVFIQTVTIKTFVLKIIHVESPVKCRDYQETPISSNLKSHDVGPACNFVRSYKDRNMMSFKVPNADKYDKEQRKDHEKNEKCVNHHHPVTLNSINHVLSLNQILSKIDFICLTEWC